MAKVGVAMVKINTNDRMVTLYPNGMMRKYETKSSIRKARNGMENGVNTADTTLAILIRILSVTMFSSIVFIS